MKTQALVTTITGFINIVDDITDEVLLDTKNGIHYENMSISQAESLSNQPQGYLYEMVFGNGGTLIDPTGIITYLTPNTFGTNSSLYNETYAKVIDTGSISNRDPTRNRMEVRHIPGTVYSDVVITCVLDYGENITGHSAFDAASSNSDISVFDELGLRSFSPSGQGRLLTHATFHPVQKALNRIIRVNYTLRLQALTAYIEQ